jgi:hypothetical protein
MTKWVEYAVAILAAAVATAAACYLLWHILKWLS